MRARLSDRVFRPATSRLGWLPIHLAVIAAATIAIASSWLPWFAVPLVSIVIGMSFAGLMFLGHELMHGGVIRGHKRLQAIVGWICFAPFTLSPRLWVAWHNRVHHAHTNEVGADPDMYPTKEIYDEDGRARFSIDNFALGGRRWRGAFSLLVGFIVQSKHILMSGPERIGMSKQAYRAAVAETVVAIALWTALALAIGGVAFVFAFAIPLVIADVIVMAFIVTNHGLSPGTEVNDPLINSMSISGPRWMEWITLGFGYHVEHHVFPGISTRHAAEVRALIRESWPERYQAMGLVPALRALHATGRVYKDATTLADPRTGGEWPALAPRTQITTEDRTPRSAFGLATAG